MKIAYVFGNEWPKESAGINYTTFSCHGLALSREYCEVELIMKKNSDKDPDEILSETFGIGPGSGLSVFPMAEKLFMNSSTGFYLRVYNYLKSRAAQGDLDVVMTRNEGFLPYMVRLKKLFGLKVYYEPHQFFMDFKLNPEKKSYKKRFFQEKFLPGVNGLICHQAPIAKLYQAKLPSQKFCIAHSGLNKIIENKNPWENNYVAYIGTLDKRKRLGDIIEALSSIKDESIKFLIIGQRKNEKLDDFMEKAKELGMENRVEVTGWLSHKELEETLKKVKIGVVPLEDNFFNRHLTSPMKIFNYFSAGIPVIGSNLDSVKDIVSDETGLFYESGDINTLVEHLKKLILDLEFYKKANGKVTEKASELLWEKRGKRIINFIDRT